MGKAKKNKKKQSNRPKFEPKLPSLESMVVAFFALAIYHAQKEEEVRSDRLRRMKE
jgi:hypothetical protein